MPIFHLSSVIFQHSKLTGDTHFSTLEIFSFSFLPYRPWSRLSFGISPLHLMSSLDVVHFLVSTPRRGQFIFHSDFLARVCSSHFWPFSLEREKEGIALNWPWLNVLPGLGSWREKAVHLDMRTVFVHHSLTMINLCVFLWTDTHA